MKMTCVMPNNELGPFQSEQQKYAFGWARKHRIDDICSSDEESLPSSTATSNFADSKPLDRVKELHDMNMRATLLNTESYRHADESMMQNSRKRLFSEYNSPDSNNSRNANEHADADGRRRLTLSQLTTTATEQEPFPEDEDVEEILMRLRHSHDYYRPKDSLNMPPTLPRILFTPPNSHVSLPSYYHIEDRYPAQYANKASLYHILSQDSTPVHSQASFLPHRHHSPSYHPSLSVNSNPYLRKHYLDEVDSEELGLEHPKKKARKEAKHARSPAKSHAHSHGNDDVQEREVVAPGLCFKTHKLKVQREYYYAKLSKTIFRWTCCGSQAKTHPDA